MRPAAVDVDDPAWVGQVRDLEDQVTRWTGNPAETVEYDVGELAALAEREDPFAEELVHETRRVTGPPLVALLSGCRTTVSPRNSPSDRQDAAKRLEKARGFLLVAETALGDHDDAAASNAALAAIAAGDAICGAALGRRAVGEDHREAGRLLNQVAGRGPEAARLLQQRARRQEQGAVPSRARRPHGGPAHRQEQPTARRDRRAPPQAADPSGVTPGSASTSTLASTINCTPERRSGAGHPR